ncbi:hypothetical protein RYX36_031506 [Vicia faba]
MFSVSSGSIHDVHPSPTQLLITSDQCFFASTIPLLCVSMLECRKSLLFALQKDDDDEYCDANQNFRNGEVVVVRVVAMSRDFVIVESDLNSWIESAATTSIVEYVDGFKRTTKGLKQVCGWSAMWCKLVYY